MGTFILPAIIGKYPFVRLTYMLSHIFQTADSFEKVQAYMQTFTSGDRTLKEAVVS